MLLRFFVTLGVFVYNFSTMWLVVRGLELLISI